MRHGGGGGLSYTIGTRGCGARKGILFRTSSPGKAILLAIWVKEMSNVKETEISLIDAKIWQVLSTKRQLMALSMSKLV